MRVEPIPGEQGAQEEAAGPLARLRAQRRHLAQQRTQEFEHPGYTGLFVTYRRLLSEDASRILYGPDGGSPVERNAQLLITACERLTYREDGQDLLTFAGFDRQLADALEIETDPHAEIGEAKQIVLGTFGGHEQPMLLHGADVYSWMLTLRKADDKALLGESAGTPASR